MKDVIKPIDMNADDAHRLQAAVARYWHDEPCGSEVSRQSRDTHAYYLEIERDRYTHEPHIPEILSWVDWSGKRVLEIGTGVGTDARQLIARGAHYHGINIDAGSCAITSRALQIFGLPGVIGQMSATRLAFADDSFDAVYSFGVLHHIPEVERAVQEIWRVLRPGGLLLFMVYNRSSINYQVEIRHLRRWGLHLLSLPGMIALLARLGLPRDKLQRHVELYRQYGRMSEAEWLSRNTDGPDNPYSVVYDAREVQALLGERFEPLRQEVFFFDWRHWGGLGRRLPRAWVQALGRRWGWHRVVLARKRSAT